MSQAPPKYALKFLRWFCREECLDEVEGDLLELFDIQAKLSPMLARWMFVFRITRYLRPEYMKIFSPNKPSPTLINRSMIKNYITLAIRNLKKRTTFSLINISGLAMGVCACLVILHYMDFETSYDKFNKNAAAIYRVHRTIVRPGEQRGPIVVTTYGLGPALYSEIPEVKRYVRTHEERSVITCQLQSGDSRAFHENNILAVDSTFFDAFTFQAITGSLANALHDPNSIVLTNTVAQKYFGQASPIGKELALAGGRLKGTYTVTAVMEDVPQNSHFTFNILVPMHNMLLTNQYSQDDGWVPITSLHTLNLKNRPLLNLLNRSFRV